MIGVRVGRNNGINIGCLVVILNATNQSLTRGTVTAIDNNYSLLISRTIQITPSHSNCVPAARTITNRNKINLASHSKIPQSLRPI